MAKMATGTKVLLGVGVAGIAGYALWKLFPEAFGGGGDEKQKTEETAPPVGDAGLPFQETPGYSPADFGGQKGGRGDTKGGAPAAGTPEPTIVLEAEKVEPWEGTLTAWKRPYAY